MTGCIPPEDLALLVALPAADPRRRHVEECARCRAAWLAYQDFVAPGRAPAEVRDRLDRALAEACGLPVSRSPRRRAWSRLWPVPALAAAAVTALVIGWPRHATPPGDRLGPAPVLRGEAAGGRWSPGSARRLPDGGLELSWLSRPEARTYRVVLLRSDGEELLRFPAQQGTRLVLEPARLPAPAGGDGPLVWRVAAETPAGEVLSEPGFLPTP